MNKNLEAIYSQLRLCHHFCHLLDGKFQQIVFGPDILSNSIIFDTPGHPLFNILASLDSRILPCSQLLTHMKVFFSYVLITDGIYYGFICNLIFPHHPVFLGDFMAIETPGFLLPLESWFLSSGSEMCYLMLAGYISSWMYPKDCKPNKSKPNTSTSFTIQLPIYSLADNSLCSSLPQPPQKKTWGLLSSLLSSSN